jgi:class 3 adenylate cyclase
MSGGRLAKGLPRSPVRRFPGLAFREIGPVELKGFAAPIAVFEVLAPP